MPRGGIAWKTDEAKRKEIVYLYASGMRVKEIARRYNLCPTYVTHLARKAGLPRRDLNRLQRLSRRISREWE